MKADVTQGNVSAFLLFLENSLLFDINDLE
ncbi:hypothetical protein J2X83_003275 [Brevibacillus nitrificans]|nr:hypothetical protein [Brevibacillus nitrificans]